MSIEAGTLYVVATPIGNLGDMSPRAQQVLAEVALIAAEDTRHSAPLLRHFGIQTKLIALHDHNERQASDALIRRLQEGASIALISDAGTPLISDPGYHFVSRARAAGVAVSPVPGASAVMAVLSVAGMATDRFAFEGFLPPKQAARHSQLQHLASEPRTLVFYESPRRVQEALADLLDTFGPEREAVVARELTKQFETIRKGRLGELNAWFAENPEQCRGEFVLVVAGAPAQEGDALDPEARRIVELLAEELPKKQAAALAARICGAKRNRLYDHLLAREA